MREKERGKKVEETGRKMKKFWPGWENSVSVQG